MPGAVKRRLAAALLRVSGLPSLAPVVPEPGHEGRLAAACEALLDRAELPRDIPLLPLLRSIAERRPVLFHGSSRADLSVLEPIRLSRDTSPFGNQQAVFATSDPVWAVYFATVRRGDGLRSTRNGSFGLPGALYPRWYLFSHNEGAGAGDRFGDGWLYVVPREGFRPQPLELGVLDTAHWASPTAVTPLVRIPVSASDFPFADRILNHSSEERMLVTILRAARSGRRARGRGRS